MTKYNCTVHTVEVWTPYVNDDAGSHDFCVEVRWKSNGYRVKINPHKLHKVNGKFQFAYRTAAQIEYDLQMCYELMGGVDCKIKRLDIALDTQRDYMDTEKIARLIALMLMDDGQNRYLSSDPLTLDLKSLTIRNGEKGSTDTKQIEHYNRLLMPQEHWHGEPVRNRFELRRMRSQIRDTDTVTSIARKWLSDFERTMTEKRMQEVIQTISDGLYERWLRYTEMRKRNGKPISKQERNMFYVCNSDNVFTKEQLRQLYLLDRKNGMSVSDTAVDNILKLDRYGTAFKLYSYKDVKQEFQAMTDALRKFAEDAE